MTVARWIQEVGCILRDLLYPPRCAGCGHVGSLFCSACHESVLWVTLPVCPLCGDPQDVQGLCTRCGRQPLQVDGIRSVAIFEGSLRQAIHQFKYSYVRDLATPLAGLLIGYWRENPIPADVIVPVPLHRRRVRERGYNQAVLLAERLAQAIGVPVSREVLYRNRYTASQMTLDGRERRRNVEGAFSCGQDDIQGKQVLLIDDVCTTGATLEACSIALKAGGARSVWALTVARAKSANITPVQVLYT